MFDKRALYDDLLDAFIKYQWRLDNPFPQPNETKEFMIKKYMNDPIFHAKVNSLASVAG